MKKLIFFYVSRLVLLILVLIIAPQIIPYKGFFPYKDIIDKYSVSIFFSLANFDGAHYLNIAREGYHTFDEAFFPLYPILLRYGGDIFLKNHLFAGLIISNLCFFSGLIFFFLLLKKRYGEKIALWSSIFLMAFPTAFFFNALYTEGLFFFLLFLSLWAAEEKKYVLSFLSSSFSSLTRIIGALIIVPFYHYYRKEKKYALIFPVLGLAAYMIYLYFRRGDPLFFLTSQPVFGANRSSSIILLPQVYFRYVKIFFMSDFSFAYLVSIFEFLVFNVVLAGVLLFLRGAIRKKDGFGISLSIFSLIQLVLPTLTGTFSSVPRYALFSPVFFIYLANINRESVKYVLLLIMILLQIAVFGYFIQGYFVS